MASSPVHLGVNNFPLGPLPSCAGDTPIRMRHSTYLDDIIQAVKEDSKQAVSRLLGEDQSAGDVLHALLFSIHLGRENISKLIINSHHYVAVQDLCNKSLLLTMHKVAGNKKLSNKMAWSDMEDAIFSSDITPIMLAAQRNQIEIVRMMMDKGDRIKVPHPHSCSCGDCESNQDELRGAKTRLNAYKALASDAYLAIAHSDPMLAAFQLRMKLKKLASNEKHFMTDYIVLSKQCSSFCAKILDTVRDDHELNTLLNEPGGFKGTSSTDLSRLRLAIHYKVKKFVTHPHIQKKVSSLWRRDFSHRYMSSPWRTVPFLLCLVLIYPFLALVYWAYPSEKNKVGKFLQIPLVKAIAASLSNVVFLGLVFATSFTISKEHETHDKRRLIDILPHSQSYLNFTDGNLNLTDGNLNLTEGNINHFNKSLDQGNINHFNKSLDQVILRDNVLGVSGMGPSEAMYLALGIWLLGFIWETIKRLYQARAAFFTPYSTMDTVMLIFYVLSYCFKFVSSAKVMDAVRYFKDEQSWTSLANNETEALDHVYYLDADRSTWHGQDLCIIAEVLFALGSWLSFGKLFYALTLFDRIGPLLISLLKMIYDVAIFTVVIFIVVVSFGLCFYNLFWYYFESFGGDGRYTLFKSLDTSVLTIFWSVYGLVDFDENNFPWDRNITTITGQALYALYVGLTNITLINVLIAMMTRSYGLTAAKADGEFKFGRTELFVWYIGSGSTLAPPFNLLPTWKSIRNLCMNIHTCCQKHNKKRDVVTFGSNKTGNRNSEVADSSNGLEESASSIKIEVTDHDAANNVLEGSGQVKTDNAAKNHGKSLRFPGLSTFGRKVKTKAEPTEEYQMMMKHLIQRFIQQHFQTSKDDNSADLEKLQKDFNSLRKDVVSTLHRPETTFYPDTNKLRPDSAPELQTTINTHMQQLQTNMDRQIQALQNAMDVQMKIIKDEMETQMKELQSKMEIKSLEPPAAPKRFKGKDSTADNVESHERLQAPILRKDTLLPPSHSDTRI